MVMFLCIEIEVIRYGVLIGFLAGAITVYGQGGFVSIDCGSVTDTSYTDNTTGIKYTPDSQYIDTGENHNISKKYLTDYSYPKQVGDLRSFPNGSRNCYTIKDVHQDGKYFIRSSFLYGNYDGQNSASSSTPLQFNLYVGVNFWKTVNITVAYSLEFYEIITIATADYFSICLVDIGKGTPFISSLELRFIDDPNAYADTTPTMSLEGIGRSNMGVAATTSYIRYPADEYDRIWIPLIGACCTPIGTFDQNVTNPPGDAFRVPSIVMNTAVTPTDNANVAFRWNAFWRDNRPVYYMYMHFAQFDNMTRYFDVFVDNELKVSNITTSYLWTSHINLTFDIGLAKGYNFSIKRAAGSTIPPILNAYEIYRPVQLIYSTTERGDVEGMMELKGWYDMKIWQGDPCRPENFSWDGVNCTFSGYKAPRVTTLNISSHGLIGGTPEALAKLKAIKYLDLSNNNLSGSIPSFLADLQYLVMLNLSGNQLSGSIPDALLRKQASGSLDLQVGNNPNLCHPGNKCSGSRMTPTTIVIATVIPTAFVILMLVIFLYWKRRTRRQKLPTPSMQLQLMEGEFTFDNSLRADKFTYPELRTITRNFGRVLGRGGFGIVYYGCLKDGVEVAVKICHNTLSQGMFTIDPIKSEGGYNVKGSKEFRAEALLLSRIHHRKLVSLIGFCKDSNHLALIYEYMSQGSLRDNLTEKAENGIFLSWRKRIEIALDAAQGLEYLHKGCSPPVVHRDVKTSNILLSSNLEAKLADFGLCKAFDTDVDTHISTNVIAGTPGYLDPEYHNTFQLTEKSDVYSFGVVLLELITGLPAIVKSQETCHILQWVHDKLSEGNVKRVVDARLHGQYDTNSARKVVDVAKRCTMLTGSKRPSMSQVVVELKASLHRLEISRKSSLHAFADTPDESLQDESLEIMHRKVSTSSIGRVPR